MDNVTIGGMATISQIRRYSAVSKVAVILVRHNNRDGHVMRSFEAAAIGTCLAVEDTEEHRAIFGSDETGVRYFSSPDGLVAAVSELLVSDVERKRLAANTLKQVRCWHHTYDARLIQVLSSDQLTTSRIAK
ncbi:MAG: glycosyltransferase [Pirellulales bacterium]